MEVVNPTTLEWNICPMITNNPKAIRIYTNDYIIIVRQCGVPIDVDAIIWHIVYPPFILRNKSKCVACKARTDKRGDCWEHLCPMCKIQTQKVKMRFRPSGVYITYGDYLRIHVGSGEKYINFKKKKVNLASMLLELAEGPATIESDQLGYYNAQYVNQRKYCRLCKDIVEWETICDNYCKCNQVANAMINYHVNKYMLSFQLLQTDIPYELIIEVINSYIAVINSQ